MRAVSCFLAAAALAAGCESQRSQGVGTPPPSPSASSVEAPPLRPVARPFPPDLDLAELGKQLGCPGAHRDACRLLREFTGAGRFTGKTPSGESRWFGKAHVVRAGQERTEFVSLVSRVVGTANVGPSDLPLLVSLAPVPDEQLREAPRLWNNLSSGPRHRANRSNLTLKYIESYEPREERGAIDTTGTSVRLITEVTEDTTYIRQPELKKLLVVRPARDNSARPGDGTYAELWQAVW